MYWTLGTVSAGDRVYQAIKARVIAYEFPQGERIYLDPLAADLGVSTTPVREAMNRLAAKDLVIKAPRKGFFALTMSVENVKGHYELTRIILSHELQRLGVDAVEKLLEYEPVGGILNKLNRRQLKDAGTLARYTGELFAAISSIRGNCGAMLSIDAANDHLYYLRTIESRSIANVQDELIHLCELLLSRNVDALIAGINTYHNRRFILLPKLVELARR
jgi:DNA-binding GntR family transcriptional regulator